MDSQFYLLNLLHFDLMLPQQHLYCEDTPIIVAAIFFVCTWHLFDQLMKKCVLFLILFAKLFHEILHIFSVSYEQPRKFPNCKRDV
jgi:hypothetical protein